MRSRPLLGVAVLGALVLVLGIGAVRYGVALAEASEARTLASGIADDLAGIGPGDLDRATVDGLRDRIGRLRGSAARLGDLVRSDPLVGLLRAVPGMAEQLDAAVALAGATTALAGGSERALGLADRFVELRETADAAGGGMLAGLVELLATAGPPIDELAASLDEAERTLATIPADVSGPVGDARARLAGTLARYRPLLAAYRELDEGLASLAGWWEPRRYLVLAQDPAELRPTGGYIGTYGIVEVAGGRIASIDFHDVYTLDGRDGMPWQEPPIALQDHLLTRASWELADANWSPDFPTAAADALRLYTLEAGDTDIDGVIAITTYALDRLLEVTGPIEVPGDPPVKVGPGEVTLEALRRTRDETLGAERKGFLDALADTALGRLFMLPPEDWPDLLGALERTGRERLAMAWFPDPALQALVEDTPFSGALDTGPGDLLYAVDANVAPSSKLNLVVERSTDLAVTLELDGSAGHMLALRWVNRADLDGEPYQTLREASEGGELYGTYTRVVVPAGSELTDAVGESLVEVAGVESIDEEAGRLAFGNYLVIRPGEASLRYTWSTPRIASPHGQDMRYALTIQKQPGMGPEPLRVSIRPPAGHVLRAASGGLVVAPDGSEAVLETTLAQDLRLEVSYGPA